jgi:hypothetical protein
MHFEQCRATAGFFASRHTSRLSGSRIAWLVVGREIQYQARTDSRVYLGGVQPSLLAPLAQVVPLGPVATPLPFFVLLLPPPVVCVVVTPLEFLFAAAPLPVLGLYAAAELPSLQTVLPRAFLVQSA